MSDLSAKLLNKRYMAEALTAAGLAWTEHNEGSHWRVPELKLDIWPTRKKTMRDAQVVVWTSMPDFVDWLLACQADSDVLPASAKPLRANKAKHHRKRSLSAPTYHRSPNFDYEDWERFVESGEIPF